MEFHSLPRRDLQFLSKKNKIPANMTNLAMADALKSLEIVEGLNEYLNQSGSNVLQCPTSVAKLPPNTATRTTRRKTAVKAEPQSSSQMVSRSCRLRSKSLDGEMNQEKVNTNVAQERETINVKIETNVAKTPAARSTRKAAAAASCSSKVQESKKGEMVQSAYSTRRSTRLLEKCMADLSLKTKETLDKPEKIEETEQKVSAQEKNPAGSEERSEESEVIPGRDLSASMEKEWDMMKNDSDPVIGGLEISVDLCDTNKETVNEVMADEKESQNSLDQVEKQEETLQADVSICEEGLKNDGNDQEIGDTEIYVDLGDIPVLEHDNTKTNNDKQESKNVQASDTLAQVDHQETEHAIQENDPETEKINTVDEVKIVDQTDGGSESEPEEDNSGVDSDGTISEADSNQAVQGSDIADEEMILSEPEVSPPLVLEEAKVETAPLSSIAADSISAQFPRPNKSASKNSAMKKLVNVGNTNKENNMEMMMMNVVNNSDDGEAKKKKKSKKKVEIDEENLKDASIRQLVKMVKELSIKSSNNRTALQALPGNNQIAE